LVMIVLIFQNLIMVPMSVVTPRPGGEKGDFELTMLKLFVKMVLVFSVIVLLSRNVVPPIWLQVVQVICVERPVLAISRGKHFLKNITPKLESWQMFVLIFSHSFLMLSLSGSYLDRNDFGLLKFVVNLGQEILVSRLLQQELLDC